MSKEPAMEAGIPDLFHAERVRKLVVDGRLVADGNLAFMRSLKFDYPDTIKPNQWVKRMCCAHSTRKPPRVACVLCTALRDTQNTTEAEHMRIILCLALCIAGPISTLADDLPLLELTFAERPVNGPVRSTMHFKEIERTATTSLVEMIYTPHREAPDQVQLIRGVCLLMRPRGEQFVQAVLISRDPIRYEVTFPKATAESPLGSGGPLSASQCARFMSR
jgi:hypothetical protein